MTGGWAEKEESMKGPNVGTSGMYEVWMAHHAHPVLEKDWDPGEPHCSGGHIEIVSSKRKVPLLMSYGVEVGSLRYAIPDLLSGEKDPDIPGWKDMAPRPSSVEACTAQD